MGLGYFFPVNNLSCVSNYNTLLLHYGRKRDNKGYGKVSSIQVKDVTQLSKIPPLPKMYSISCLPNIVPK